MDKAGGRAVTIGVVAFLTLGGAWSARRRLTLALFGKGEGECAVSAAQRLNEELRPSDLSLPPPSRGRAGVRGSAGRPSMGRSGEDTPRRELRAPGASSPRSATPHPDPLPQGERGRCGAGGGGLVSSVIPEAARRLSGIGTPPSLPLKRPDPGSSRAPHAAAGMTEGWRAA